MRSAFVIGNVDQHLQVRTLHSLSIAGMEIIKLLLALPLDKRSRLYYAYCISYISTLSTDAGTLLLLL